MAVGDRAERGPDRRGERRREGDPADDARGHGDHAAVGGDSNAGRRLDLDAVLVPADPHRGIAEPDPAAEPLGQTERQALVAAGDAWRRFVVDVCQPAHGARRNHLAGAAGRDLQPRENRLAGAGFDLQPVEQLARGDRVPGIGGERVAHRADPLGERLRRRAEPAARLAAAVAHALLPEAEPEIIGEPRDLGVAGQDELGAHLDRRPVGQPLRPGSAPDPVAGLDDLDLPAARLELGCGGEAGEAGADDDRTAERCAQRSVTGSRGNLTASGNITACQARPAQPRARPQGARRRAAARQPDRAPDRGSGPAPRRRRAARSPARRAPRRCARS